MAIMRSPCGTFISCAGIVVDQAEGECPLAPLAGEEAPRGAVLLRASQAVMRGAGRLEGDCVLLVARALRPRRAADPQAEVRQHAGREGQLQAFAQRAAEER